MKAVQYFSDEYLQQCRDMSSEQVLRFLDDFRRLHARRPSTSKLISMKVPQDLLDAFKAKAKLNGKRYQAQIKALMRAWVLE